MLALNFFIYAFTFYYANAEQDSGYQQSEYLASKMSITRRCSSSTVLQQGYYTNVLKKKAKLDNPVIAVVHKRLIATARSCMVKVNGTEADLEHLRKDPPYPEKSSCILTCLMEKIGVVSNNKYSKTGFLTAVMPLVLSNGKKLQHMKNVSESCSKEVNHQHISSCLLGNEIITCIYKYAPELHFNKHRH